MAIQMRRGNKADLDTTQLKPGEFAVPTDKGEVWAKVTSSEAKRLATLDATGRLEQMPTAADVGAVPTTRTVNGKALSSNITLSAADVGAVPTSQLLDYVYPVGSVYISTSSTSPAAIIGGTWERIQDRFLLGAGTSYTAGTTGGEAEHTLTVAEIPSHTHNDHTNLDAKVVAGNDYCGVTSGMQGETAATGGGLAHNNMPPYLAVYMWTRTA